ncbi:hypothetical protein BMR07_16090 [Methylococcaceae bacterium CS1]|nr:hypothetical protein BMR07_16090 [Methylococcaceae bacterium CS1]
MSESVGKELFSQGWAQGTYLFCESLSADFHLHCWATTENLEKQLTDKRNTLILLSQNCDITAKYTIEKTIEFVIARRPKKKKPPHFLNLYAKSTRFLELELTDGFWYKAEASKVLQIDKQDFINQITAKAIQPSALEKTDCEVLTRWRANRYMRVALPDSFENKIRSLRENNIFDNGLEHAGSLYLSLEPFEESEHYIVRLFALHRQNSPPESYDSLFKKMEQVIESLNTIEGLTCPYLEKESNENFEAVYPAMRRSEVTVELLDHFIRWNFDSISLSEGDNEGIDKDI